MIELLNLKKGFGNSLLFEIEHLTFPSTGLVVIKGENGCGKTTLLNILSLLDSHYDGTVLFDGKDIKSFKEKDKTKFRRDNISYVFQKNNLISFCDIGTNLSLYDEESLKDERKPNTLSQGQQEIIAIKRALKQKKKIYLFDEVLSSLDAKNRNYLIEEFKKLSLECLVIVVSHDVNVEDIASGIYEFKDHSLSAIKRNTIRYSIPPVSCQEQVIHKKRIIRSYLLHSKAFSVMNMLLMCLMLCFGYAGCEASYPDLFFKAHSAIGDNPYVLLNGKSDMTSAEILQCYPDNAYECIHSDFPLVKSKDVPDDGQVYCNQKTYDYWLNEMHHRITDDTLTLNADERYAIAIDDTIRHDVFLLNSSSDSGGIVYNPQWVLWNYDVSEFLPFNSSLFFYNELAFTRFYKIKSLPFSLEDDVFYVFNEKLASAQITEYKGPTVIDRNSYVPDFNELFGNRMRAEYVSLNVDVSPNAVLMSDNTAKILKNEYQKHATILICPNGIKFNLAKFISSHRYTINPVVDDSGNAMQEYNHIIQAVTNSTTTFTYGIFLYFMLVMIPLVEIALFSYTCFLNRNNVRSLYSLGMSRWSIYLMLILPFFITFMIATVLGGILSLIAGSFQFLSFGLGSLYTLLLLAMIFAGSFLLWLRRIKQ